MDSMHPNRISLADTFVLLLQYPGGYRNTRNPLLTSICELSSYVSAILEMDGEIRGFSRFMFYAACQLAHLSPPLPARLQAIAIIS